MCTVCYYYKYCPHYTTSSIRTLSDLNLNFRAFVEWYSAVQLVIRCRSCGALAALLDAWHTTKQTDLAQYAWVYSWCITVDVRRVLSSQPFIPLDGIWELLL
jgi:hypothetical protein